MTEILELSNRDFKKAMIDVLRALMKKCRQTTFRNWQAM